MIDGDAAANSIQVSQRSSNGALEGARHRHKGERRQFVYQRHAGDRHLDRPDGRQRQHHDQQGSVSGEILWSDASGNDTYIASNVTTGLNFEVNDSGGNNVAVWTKINAGTFLQFNNFDGSSGNDTVSVTNSTAGTFFQVNTGGGTNVAAVNSVTANGPSGTGFLQVNGNAGKDVFAINNSHSTNDFLQAQPGDGTNVVTITNSTSESYLMIIGGSGNDTAAIANSKSLDSFMQVLAGDGNNAVALTNVRRPISFRSKPAADETAWRSSRATPAATSRSTPATAPTRLASTRFPRREI